MTTQSGDLRTECVRDAINRRLDRVARIVIPCYLPSRTDFPVLIHELRIRQRGIKPFAILFVYTTVLSIIALTTLSISTQNSAYTPPQPQTISAQNPARQGRTLFTVLSMAQLAMTCCRAGNAHQNARLEGVHDNGRLLTSGRRNSFHRLYGDVGRAFLFFHRLF